MIRLSRWLALAIAIGAAVPAPLGAASGSAVPKRIAFLVDSWYPRSHADVIGTRFLTGYRVGDKVHASPLTVASVHTDLPRNADQTRALAARYGFRVAGSIAEALLDNPQSVQPQLAVDGVLVATREDVPGSGPPQSPNSRLQVVREVLRVSDRAGARLPMFVDKMIAASWADSQTIIAETSRRGTPLMAGSVLPFTPLDHPLRPERVQVGVVIASTPYWAYAFHAAELLQAFMELRGPRETGVSAIRDAGPAYSSMPNRDQWGGRVFDTLLASAKTRGSRRTASVNYGPETTVLLLQYVDGTRAVLALIPDVFDDSEFLLGAQYADGTIGTSGLVLRGEPFDHFGYLVHALVTLYTTGRSPVPAERTALTTGIVLFGQQAKQSGAQVTTPALAISYSVRQARP